MTLRLLFAVGGVVLVTGCGGHASTYAGMTNYEAAAESADIIAQESVKPKSPIHGLHPRLSKLVRDKQEEGYSHLGCICVSARCSPWGSPAC